MDRKKSHETQRQSLLEYGQKLFLHSRKITIEELLGLSGLPRSAFHRAFSSLEDYILNALQYALDRHYLLLYEEAQRGATQRKLSDIYRVFLLELQTQTFIDNMERAYQKLSDKGTLRFWQLLEEYAYRILILFQKSPSVSNKRVFLYCLSFIYSARALRLRHSSVSILSGGSVEIEMLIREIRQMPNGRKERKPQPPFGKRKDGKDT